jgi:hypothetical protein
VLQYADWRPYEYYTASMSVTKRSLSAAPENTHTIETLPLDGDRTLLRWRIRIHNHGLAMRAMMLVLRPMFKRELRADLAKLSRMLENDLAERKTVEGT